MSAAAPGENGRPGGRFVVGIDLGGTKVAVGVGDLRGSIVTTRSIPTLPEQGHEAVIRRFCDLAVDLLRECGAGLQDLAAVGLGSPGPVSHKTGMVYEAPNLKWRNVPVRDLTAERLRAPCYVDNDANLAGLGEWKFGAGRGTRDMVYVTWSTGIGGGLILDGRLFHGADNCAGEVGHIVVDPDGPVCACGRRGCLEALASGTAIAREGARAVREIAGHTSSGASPRGALWDLTDGDPARVTAMEVAQAARSGDPVARDIMARAGTYLGLGLSSVVNLLNPEMIVIGGGVSAAYDLVAEVVSSVVAERTVARAGTGVRITLAALGSGSGVAGAVAYALAELNTD